MFDDKSFQGKSILFIGPCFHNYEVIIIQKLINYGAEVVFYPERDYSIKFKIINNLNTSLLCELQKKHYSHVLKKIKSKHFDYLFVIRGYMISKEFLSKFHSMNPSAIKIMYQWDSNRTNPFESIIPYFNKVLSFDYEDCKLFSLEYLPLFYTDDIISEELKNIYNSDFFFMGSYIPERYNALLNFIQKYGNEYNINSFIYLPFSSLIKEKLKRTKLNYSIISTHHMPRAIYLSMLKGTKVMVDVSNKYQTGLAIRIIEALSMHKKVATNNEYIQDEPFYNPKNICIFNTEKPYISSDFFNTPFWGEPYTLSLNEWLKKIFELE